MTYGWAILVVLAAVGALAYFGVFDTGNLLPEECTMGQGMTCDDDLVRTDGVQFRIENALQTGVDITGVTLNADACNLGAAQLAWNNGTSISSTPFSVQNREAFRVNASCASGSITSRAEVDFDISYQEEGETVTRTLSGTVAGSPQ